MTEYLDRHLERSLPERRDLGRLDLPESVLRTLGPNIEFKESGTERVELQEGGALMLSSEPVTEPLITEYQADLRYPSHLVEALAAGRYFRLTGFVLENTAGEKLALDDLPVRNVFFGCTRKDLPHAVAAVEVGDVFLEEPPTSPYGILALLHEIGHIVDHARMTERERQITDSLRSGFRAESLNFHILPSQHRRQAVEGGAEVTLKAERNAWAYALQQIKPYLSLFDLPRDDLMKTIHDVMLTAYSQEIRETLLLEPGLLKVLQSLARRLLDRKG